jgi:hypothetical protein
MEYDETRAGQAVDRFTPAAAAQLNNMKDT